MGTKNPDQWKQKFGTPPPTQWVYSKIKKCTSFWSWLWYDWNYVTASGYREIGHRRFGFDVRRFYIIPRGELRF